MATRGIVCIGASKKPCELIARLANPNSTEANSLGDDVFRHRLVTAAIALSEIKPNLIDQDLASEIADQVWESLNLTRELGRVPDQHIPAFRSLAIVNPMLKGKPFNDLCAEESRRIAGSIPQIGKAIDTPGLREKLMHTLGAGRRSTTMMISPRDIGAIRALIGVSGNQTFDELADSLPTYDSEDEPRYWAIVAEAFRFSQLSEVAKVSVTQSLLDQLEAAIFLRRVDVKDAALRVCRFLPRGENSIINNSSLAQRCRHELAHNDSEKIRRFAEMTLRNLQLVSSRTMSLADENGSRLLDEQFLEETASLISQPDRRTSACKKLLNVFKSRISWGIRIRNLLPHLDDCARSLIGREAVGFHDSQILDLIGSKSLVDRRLGALFLQLSFCFRLTNEVADWIIESLKSESAPRILTALSFDPNRFGDDAVDCFEQEIAEGLLERLRKDEILEPLYAEPPRQTLRFAAYVYGNTDAMREILAAALNKGNAALSREAARTISGFEIELDERFADLLVPIVSASRGSSNSDLFRALTLLPRDSFDRELVEMIISQFARNRSSFDVLRACKLIHSMPDLCFEPLMSLLEDPTHATPLVPVLLGRCGDMVLSKEFRLLKKVKESTNDLVLFHISTVANAIPFCSDENRKKLMIAYAGFREKDGQRSPRPEFYMHDVSNDYFEWLWCQMASDDEETREASTRLFSDMVASQRFDNRKKLVEQLINADNAAQCLVDHLSIEMQANGYSASRAIQNLRIVAANQLLDGFTKKGYRFFESGQGLVCKKTMDLAG